MVPTAKMQGLFASEAAAKQPYMVDHLHYDILSALFRFFDEGTLYNCSVVNKEFNLIASQNLYHAVVLGPSLWHPGLKLRTISGVSVLVKAVLSTEMAD
jgi:hypothetical protein